MLLRKCQKLDLGRIPVSYSASRHGATLVEFAVVVPIVFFLILATFVGGMGVFRYQAVATMAREAARYACTHGGNYARDNNQAIIKGTLPSVSKSYIINNVALPNAVSMDKSKVNVTITLNTSSGSFDWDDTANNGNRWPNSPKNVNGSSYSETNTVSVTVTYTWVPEAYLAGPITLTATSVMPMSY